MLSNIAKHTFPIDFLVKSLNLPFLRIFSVDLDNDPEGILRKEKHFQQTVFHLDFKSAVKSLIFGFLLTHGKFKVKRGNQDVSLSS